MPYWPASGAYISDHDLDLVVARVASVNDSNGTVSNPPRVRLRIERVLRGSLKPGPIQARWVPWLDPPFRCGNESAAEEEAWDRYYESRLNGPTVGSRLLLAGVWDSESKTWNVSDLVRFPHSRALEAQLLSDVHRADAGKRAAAARGRRSDQAPR